MPSSKARKGTHCGRRSAGTATLRRLAAPACLCLWLMLGLLGRASAGPPFVTDDPEPTPEGGFELYLYAEGVHSHAGDTGTLPGLEINYGAAADLQLALAAGEAYTAHHDTVTRHYDATELSAKYRFVHEDPQGWQPQIAFYPSVDIPRNGKNRQPYLPVWAQKSFGRWEVFGGGGPRWNPQPGGTCSWFSGIAALHPASTDLQLGAELFRQTAETRDERTRSGFNLAALYDFDPRWHLVGSAGRGVGASAATNRYSYYLGLELTAP